MTRLNGILLIILALLTSACAADEISPFTSFGKRSKDDRGSGDDGGGDARAERTEQGVQSVGGAGLALRLQEHRVHVHGGRDARRPGLEGLGAADLAAVGRDGGVVRHVLRLERPHPEAPAGVEAGEPGNDQRLADIGAGALDHQGAGRRRVVSCGHGSSGLAAASHRNVRQRTEKIEKLGWSAAGCGAAVIGARPRPS